jgi:hypothetical protein
MSFTAKTQEPESPNTITLSPESSHQQRIFQWALLAIVLGALLPCLVIGRTQFIHYDGYWHIFIATQDRWRLFLSEWRGDAHPIFYYLLLRAAAKLGHSHLIYRSISIGSGVAAVYVVGNVGKLAFSNRTVALLAAGAYGFSLTLIDLACDVRGYSLALLLVLCSFYYLAKLLQDPGDAHGPQSLVASSAFASLAIATEYYAVFFVLASGVALFLQLSSSRDLRLGLKQLFHRSPFAVFISAALPCLTSASLYIAHLRYQPSTENNVAEFYRSPGHSISTFLATGLQSDLDYLSPIETHFAPGWLFLVAAIAVALICGRLLWRSAGRIALTLPYIVLVTLLIELMILSVARRYPFGGFARQQSIIFPFIVLTTFAFIDAVLRRLRNRILQTTILIIIAAAIAASFAYHWRKFPKVPEELFTRDYKTFSTLPPGPVYLDQFSLIAYYIHTHAWKWHFEHYFHEPDRIDSYETFSPSGSTRTVLRNLDAWNFEILKPEFYEILARTLTDAGLRTVNIFFLKQFPQVVDRPEAAQRAEIESLARGAGFTVGPIIYDNGHCYMTLKRQ